MHLWVIFFTLFLYLCLPVSADIITLKNGDTIEGTIVAQNEESITLDMGVGKFTFKRSEIESIAQSAPSIERVPESTYTPPQPPPKKREKNTVKTQSTNYNSTKPSHVLSPATSYQSEDVDLDGELQYFIQYFGTKDGFLDAVKKYTERARTHPEDIDNHYRLGLSYFYLKKYEAAISELTTVINNKPNDSEALKFLGFSHYKLGNYENAIEYFERRLTLRPQDKMTRSVLAACYYTKNDFKNAAVHYERLHSYDPNDTRIIARLIHIYKSLGNEEKQTYFETLQKDTTAGKKID